jgi:hypothetical protein
MISCAPASFDGRDEARLLITGRKAQENDDEGDAYNGYGDVLRHIALSFSYFLK